MKLKKWSDVYPHGTKEGDDEYAFFRALTRNAKWSFLSTSAIANESNLSKEKVEQIIKKYLKIGLIFQNPKDDGSWGYWERIPEEMLPKDYESLVTRDQKKRMKKCEDAQ